MSSQQDKTPEAGETASIASEEVKSPTYSTVASAIAALELGKASIASDKADGSPSKKVTTPQQSPSKKQKSPKASPKPPVSSPSKEKTTPAKPDAVEDAASDVTIEKSTATAGSSTEKAAAADETTDSSTAPKEEAADSSKDEPKPQRERSNSRYRNYAPRGGLVSPPFKRNFNLEDASGELKVTDVEVPKKEVVQPEVKKAERDRDRPGYFRARTVRRDSEKSKPDKKDPAIIESKKSGETAETVAGTSDGLSPNVKTRKRRNRRNKVGNNDNQRGRANTQELQDLDDFSPPSHRGRSFSGYGDHHVNNYGGNGRYGGYQADRYHHGPPSPGNQYGQYRPYFHGPQAYHYQPYYQAPRHYNDVYNYPPRQFNNKTGPWQPQYQRGNGNPGRGQPRQQQQRGGQVHRDTERSPRGQEPAASGKGRSHSIEVTIES
jgi:hypothetical protein